MRSPKRSDLIATLHRAWVEFAILLGNLTLPIPIRLSCWKSMAKIADLLFGKNEPKIGDDHE